MKRIVSLFLVLVLALSLTGCSKDEIKDWASDVIIDLCVRFGFISGESDEEDTADVTRAPQGGSIYAPEGWDYKSTRITTTVQDNVLYVGFNGINLNVSTRSTGYFVATAESTTLTCYGTSTNADAETPPRFKAAVWELAEDEQTTSYVLDSTVYFSAAGEGVCATQTVTGLTPGRRYKITISYDSTSFSVTGLLSATNVSDQPLTEPDEAA